MTQSQLARKVGTSQQAISRLEQAGYENVRLDTLRRVAKALDARVAVTLVGPGARRSANRARSRPKSGTL